MVSIRHLVDETRHRCEGKLAYFEIAIVSKNRPVFPVPLCVLLLSLALLAVPAVLGLDCSEEFISSAIADYENATVNYVYAVAEGDSFGIPSLAFPDNATNLPAVCAVGVNVKSSEDSSYNFGLFLPDTIWNSRFLATGNGGFGGGINWYANGPDIDTDTVMLLTFVSQAGHGHILALRIRDHGTCILPDSRIQDARLTWFWYHSRQTLATMRRQLVLVIGG